MKERGTYRKKRQEVVGAGEAGAVSRRVLPVLLDQLKVHRMLVVRVECMIVCATAKFLFYFCDLDQKPLDVAGRVDYEVERVCSHGLSELCDSALWGGGELRGRLQHRRVARILS